MRSMTLFEATLPWPPTVNTYWRRVGTRMLISADGREFHRRVAQILKLRLKYDGYEVVYGRLNPIDDRVAFSIQLFPPDQRRRDIDNIAKALLDSLQKCGVYHDDNQIDELHIRRCKVDKLKYPSGAVNVQIIKREESDDAD